MAQKRQIISQSVIKTRNKLGESPVWSHKEHALYWTDIEEKLIFRYVPQTKQFSSFELPCKVGSLGLVENGGLILAVEDVLLFGMDTGKLLKCFKKPSPTNRHA